LLLALPHQHSLVKRRRVRLEDLDGHGS
jgi:hypothetical protein